MTFVSRARPPSEGRAPSGCGGDGESGELERARRAAESLHLEAGELLFPLEKSHLAGGWRAGTGGPCGCPSRPHMIRRRSRRGRSRRSASRSGTHRIRTRQREAKRCIGRGGWPAGHVRFLTAANEYLFFPRLAGPGILDCDRLRVPSLPPRGKRGWEAISITAKLHSFLSSNERGRSALPGRHAVWRAVQLVATGAPRLVACPHTFANGMRPFPPPRPLQCLLRSHPTTACVIAAWTRPIRHPPSSTTPPDEGSKSVGCAASTPSPSPIPALRTALLAQCTALFALRHAPRVTFAPSGASSYLASLARPRLLPSQMGSLKGSHVREGKVEVALIAAIAGSMYIIYRGRSRARSVLLIPYFPVR